MQFVVTVSRFDVVGRRSPSLLIVPSRVRRDSLPYSPCMGRIFLYTGLSSNKRSVDLRLERHLRVRGLVPVLTLARSTERGRSGGCTSRFQWRTRTVLHSGGCTTKGSVRATPKNALRALQRGPRVVNNLDDAPGGHVGLCWLLLLSGG